MNDRIFVLVMLCMSVQKNTMQENNSDDRVNKKGNKILNEPHVLTAKSRVSYILKFMCVSMDNIRVCAKGMKTEKI